MESQKKDDKKTVKPLSSIHVVNYACGNCSEEEEHAKLCSSCKAPMRVVQVVELYGDEANEYVENLRKKGEKEEKQDGVSSVQYDDSVIGLNEEEETDDTEELELGEIFPDDSGDDDKRFAGGNLGDDFESALDALDQEDDDEDIEDLPEL